MLHSDLAAYIRALPIGEPAAIEAAPATRPGAGPADATGAPDPGALPDAVVSGSTLIGFDATVGPALRQSVALSLLAAQRVADADPVVASPDAWVARHDMVLRGLNWVSAGGGTVFSDVVETRVAVHEAITPFLVAAFGPAASAGALILTALAQLREVEENAPWIALLDRESRRFDVCEYRFATATAEGNLVALRIAAARFLAVRDRVQLLVFRFGGTGLTLRTASATLAASAGLLEAMNGALERRLRAATADFIRALPL